MLRFVIEIHLLLVMFGACYFLFLKDTVPFKISRAILLLLPLIVLLLPLLPATFFNDTIPQPGLLTSSLEELLVTPQASPASFSWQELVVVLYLCVMGIFLLRLAWRLWRIFHLIFACKRERRVGYTLVKAPKVPYAASFFGYLLVGKFGSLSAEERNYINYHEKAHIRLGHSWDVMIMELCCTFFWINPMVFALKNELQLVHEFQADAAVNSPAKNRSAYGRLLLKSALGVQHLALLNSIFQSNIKKRIIMLNRRKITFTALSRAFVAIPVFALIIFGYSCTKNDRLNDEQEVKGNLVETAQVESLPEFPGGQEKMYQYIGEQVKYPPKAKEAGIEGTAVVQFIVDADGSIKKTKVLNEVNEDLAAEAMRVIQDMPGWKPAKAKGEMVAAEMVLPIMFVLEE